MADNVEPHMAVLYGVWEPTTGWAKRNQFGTISYVRTPHFYQKHHHAKKLAMECKAQLVVFDVTPSLRSWPSLESVKPAEKPAETHWDDMGAN